MKNPEKAIEDIKKLIIRLKESRRGYKNLFDPINVAYGNALEDVIEKIDEILKES